MLDLERVLVQLLTQATSWGEIMEFLMCQLDMLEQSYLQQEWALLAIRRKLLKVVRVWHSPCYWGEKNNFRLFKGMSPGRTGPGRTGSVFISPMNVQQKECGV